MGALILFIATIIGLNCVPLLIKTKFPKLEKVIAGMLITTSFIWLIVIILIFNDYRIKGIYSTLILYMTFIISNVLFFIFLKNTKKKLLAVLIMTPLIFLTIFLSIFGQVIANYRINSDYKIEVSRGGFLGCGEVIKITKSEF